jgi:hypothetical protein
MLSDSKYIIQRAPASATAIARDETLGVLVMRSASLSLTPNGHVPQPLVPSAQHGPPQSPARPPRKPPRISQPALPPATPIPKTLTGRRTALYRGTVRYCHTGLSASSRYHPYHFPADLFTRHHCRAAPSVSWRFCGAHTDALTGHSWWSGRMLPINVVASCLHTGELVLYVHCTFSSQGGGSFSKGTQRGTNPGDGLGPR